MSSVSFLDHLAVCSWSLQPDGPQQLARQLHDTGIHRVQLALDPLRENPAVWDSTADLFRRENITIVSGMFGTIGEDYSTMDTIQHTGGVVPDATWEQNQQNIRVVADIAARLEIKLVTFHAGFLSHDVRDPGFAKLLQRLRLVADIFAAKQIELGFETGQETAPDLKRFLQQLDRKNMGVNFDPANMILYDKGDPIEALRALGPWLKQCHIKDANRTKTPGVWGEEVAAGTGQVDWRAFFRALIELKFTGDCCIEREAGNQRGVDIRTAREMVSRVSS